MIYFIQAESGPIKIGWTEGCPFERRKQLQSTSPQLLRLLAVAPGGAAREAALHRQHSADRLHGEWFAPSAEILAEVAVADSVPEAAVRVPHVPDDRVGHDPWTWGESRVE